MTARWRVERSHVGTSGWWAFPQHIAEGFADLPMWFEDWGDAVRYADHCARRPA